MRVWIENPFDNLPPEGYRPQRYWLMAQAFAAAGHEVVYWTSDFSHANKAPRRLQDDFFGYGFRLRLVPTLPYSENVSWARVRSHRAYARAWHREAIIEAEQSGLPELLVVSAPPLATGRIALWLRRRYGCRVVCDVQDLWPETFERLLPRPLRWLSPLVFFNQYRQAKRLYQRSDLVTGVCDAYGARLRELGVRRYSRTYLGIELQPPVAERPLLIRDDEFRIVYAGNLGRSYDLETVVRAVAQLAWVRLTIAGEGEQLSILRELVARLGCAERVVFAGYLSKTALRALCASSDAGIVPMDSSSRVGLPNKFADYSEASLAVLSSLEGESSALLERYGAGLCYRPHDCNDLVSAIHQLREELPVYRAGARRMAVAEFDATVIYRSYVALLTRK